MARPILPSAQRDYNHDMIVANRLAKIVEDSDLSEADKKRGKDAALVLVELFLKLQTLTERFYG